MERNVSGVPHRGQKVRVPWSEERNVAGWPERTENPELGTLNQATKGAALPRLQIEQWQFVSFDRTPSTRYRMKPQEQ